MRTSSPRRTSGPEEGAVAVITALLLTVLLLSAALVLDLAGLRADRVQSKSVADMAAAASVATYDPDVQDAAVAACQDAVDFARANLGDEVAGAQVGFSCTDIYTSYVCNPLEAPDPPATYRIGDRLVEILIPVPTGHPLMEELDHGQGFDGTPCDRVGVRVSRDRTFLLARITPGVDGASTTQGSVGVTTIDGRELEYASLIVLQRNGCQTLQNAGSGVFRVFSLKRFEDEDGKVVSEETPEAELQTYPGTITTDTLPAGCGGQKKIIETSNNAKTWAEGDIYAHSLVSADSGNASTYNPAHVASGALSPGPKAGPMITRALVDHQYNCQTVGYGDAGPLWSPLRGNQPIDPCASTDEFGTAIETPPPYLEQLDAVVESVMSEFVESGEPPDDWSVFPAAGETCSSDTLPKTGGRWIVDCPETLNPRNLIFQDAEHIIFREGLELGTNADVLTIEASSITAGTTVTMYENGLEMNGGELRMRNVFTYIRSAATGGTSGRIDVSGSVNRFAVQGPLEGELVKSACDSYEGAPPAVCFAPVAIWSNFVGTGDGNSLNAVSGNAAGGIIGTVFTPNSLFRFRGSGDAEIESCGEPSWELISKTAATLELVGAQFFTNTINVAGDAEIGMCPNPDTTIGVPIRGSRLIR